MNPRSTFDELLSRLGSTLADFVIFCTALADSPVWQGAFVDVAIEVGKTEVTVPHGLGRAHRGAFVVLTIPPDPIAQARPLYVLPPSDDKHVKVVIASASTRVLRSRLWVFG